MESVKFTLLIFHFWTCFVDILVGILVAPYLLAPLFAGFSMGILGKFGIGYHHQTVLVMVSTAAMYVSIMCVYENRFFILSLDKQWWRLARIPWYILNYSLTVFPFLTLYLLVPEQEGAMQWISEKLPCLPPEIQSQPIFLITQNVLPMLISAMTLCTFISTEALIFCILVKKALNQYGKLSRNTVELQKKFLKAVILQLLIPSIFLITPLSWLVWSGFLKLYNQKITNFSFILLSTHGFFSTLFMIYVQLPYRDVLTGYCIFLGRMVGLKCERRKNSMTTVFQMRTSVVF